jgi:hypothetical protein
MDAGIMGCSMRTPDAVGLEVPWTTTNKGTHKKENKFGTDKKEIKKVSKEDRKEGMKTGRT